MILIYIISLPRKNIMISINKLYGFIVKIICFHVEMESFSHVEYWIERTLPDHCSVYQVEIIAIMDVAEWLRYNVLTKAGISVSVLLIKKITYHCRKSVIQVIGHSNIPEHCNADKLARLGTSLKISVYLEVIMAQNVINEARYISDFYKII